MKLIECSENSDLKLREFDGKSIPAYAILSHTWAAEEILFDDIVARNDISQKNGHRKVVESCRLARQDGYEYVWIDTCCIDKSSSAELTEAINSMFNWYSRAGRCYVYLNDFDGDDPASDLSQSRWFKRGWTLQELVAPTDIRFYDKNWAYFGSKAELEVALSTITGIDRFILNGAHPPFVVPASKKLSWAAHRETTREEDLAYCLLGVFGISMPLVCGEGPRAFIRLQEEIIRESNDLTLFAWQAEPGVGPEGTAYRGILAQSPREFANAGIIVSNANRKNNPEFTMTNKGLRIEMPLRRGPANSVVMSLNCRRESSGHETVGIYLADIGGGVYVRALPQKLASNLAGKVWRDQTIYIMKHVNDVRYL